MVGLPGLANDAPAVRRPLARLDGDEAWSAAILALRCDFGLAPAVGSVLIEAVAAEAPKPPEPGAEAELSLGYADGEEAVVCTGSVTRVEQSLDGRLRLRLADAGWQLARTRVARSWEQQGVADLIGELADAAGVAIETMSGPTLPFVALDRDRPALDLIVELAAVAGCWVHAVPAGGLVMAKPEAGQVVQTFTGGVDILAASLRQLPPTTGAVSVVGAGAAGGSGEEAWPWAAREVPRGEAGDGAPQRRLAHGALRSQAAVDGLAAALSAAAGRRSRRAELLVPGAPAVALGSTVTIEEATPAALDGDWLVTEVHHRFSSRQGFTSRLALVAADGGIGGLP